MYAIEINQLSKVYKNGVQALDGFDLCVKEGDIFTLLGENGAGKSTLIKILTTYLKSTSGTVKMLGLDLNKEADKIRKQIACVFQQTSIDTFLSLEENMLFQGKLYSIPNDEAIKRMESLITVFGLSSYRNLPVSSYSGGVKRRLDIALNLMSNPKILFLDEPTVGMDVQSRNAMWDMVKKIRSELGTTIFLTTHYLEEAEVLSDSICIMKKGKNIVWGSRQELAKLLDINYIELCLLNLDIKKIKEYLCNKFPKWKLILKDSSIYIQNDKDIMDLLLKFLLQDKIQFESIGYVKPSLEDIFIQVLEEANI